MKQNTIQNPCLANKLKLELMIQYKFYPTLYLTYPDIHENARCLPEN